MPKSREPKFDFWYGAEERKKLVEIYGTDYKPKIKELIKQRSLLTTEELLDQLGLDPQSNPTSYKLRLEKAKVEYWEEKARLTKAKADLAEKELVYVGVFKSKPSPEAKEALRQHVENKIKHQNTSILKDDGTLKCISCGKIFPMRAYDFEQGNDYQTHVKVAHQRELYIESETPIIAKLLGIESQ